MLSCIDAKTGGPVWQERLGGCSGRRLSTPTAGSIFSDNEGTATVGEIGRAWKKIASNKLDDGCA